MAIDSSKLKILESLINKQEQEGSSNFHVFFSKPDESLSNLDDGKATSDLLKQRQDQRSVLFNFVMWATGVILFIYFGLILLQAYLRTCDQSWSFIGEKGFIYLTSGVFIYFLGVVIIITKSLWNEAPYEKIHQELLTRKAKGKK